jgi:hypothetical protein
MRVVAVVSQRFTWPWDTMTVKDRLMAFLIAQRLRNFCDQCVARTLGIDPSTAYRAATRLTLATGFVREYGVCSECGDSRLIARASG